MHSFCSAIVRQIRIVAVVLTVEQSINLQEKNEIMIASSFLREELYNRSLCDANTDTPFQALTNLIYITKNKIA